MSGVKIFSLNIQFHNHNHKIFKFTQDKNTRATSYIGLLYIKKAINIK